MSGSRYGDEQVDIGGLGVKENASSALIQSRLGASYDRKPSTCICSIRREIISPDVLLP